VNRAMIPAVIRCFTALCGEGMNLQEGIEDGTIHPADGCREQDGGAIADRWAKSLAVRRLVIVFF
jgi:hypothetical protein